ncbi:hypothetical protein HMPREF0185_02954 [Brevundimonas diminuta 470-4]|nr:hypothetical protein HMPREF0185_02954 [Brevundimonas diminuta 470-4]
MERAAHAHQSGPELESQGLILIHVPKHPLKSMLDVRMRRPALH